MLVVFSSRCGRDFNLKCGWPEILEQIKTTIKR